MKLLERYGFECVEKKTNLTLQMWATNKATYDKAVVKGKLNKLLSDAGLKVSSFEIFNEERPGMENRKRKNIF